MKLCFGGAMPAKGHSKVGPTQKADGLHCSIGSGLGGKGGEVDDSL